MNNDPAVHNIVVSFHRLHNIGNALNLLILDGQKNKVADAVLGENVEINIVVVEIWGAVVQKKHKGKQNNANRRNNSNVELSP